MCSFYCSLAHCLTQTLPRSSLAYSLLSSHSSSSSPFLHSVSSVIYFILPSFTLRSLFVLRSFNNCFFSFRARRLNGHSSSIDCHSLFLQHCDDRGSNILPPCSCYFSCSPISPSLPHLHLFSAPPFNFSCSFVFYLLLFGFFFLLAALPPLILSLLFSVVLVHFLA